MTQNTLRDTRWEQAQARAKKVNVLPFLRFDRLTWPGERHTLARNRLAADHPETGDAGCGRDDVNFGSDSD